MATYEELSQDDRDELDALMALVRPQSAAIYNAAILAGAIVSAWNNSVSAIVATLDAGAAIPNKTGLSGARDVTKENLANNLMAYVTTTASMGTTAHRDNIEPAAGAYNLQNPAG